MNLAVRRVRARRRRADPLRRPRALSGGILPPVARDHEVEPAPTRWWCRMDSTGRQLLAARRGLGLELADRNGGVGASGRPPQRLRRSRPPRRVSHGAGSAAAAAMTRPSPTTRTPSSTAASARWARGFTWTPTSASATARAPRCARCGGSTSATEPGGRARCDVIRDRCGCGNWRCPRTARLGAGAGRRPWCPVALAWPALYLAVLGGTSALLAAAPSLGLRAAGGAGGGGDAHGVGLRFPFCAGHAPRAALAARRR